MHVHVRLALVHLGNRCNASTCKIEPSAVVFSTCRKKNATTAPEIGCPEEGCSSKAPFRNLQPAVPKQIVIMQIQHPYCDRAGQRFYCRECQRSKLEAWIEVLSLPDVFVLVLGVQRSVAAVPEQRSIAESKGCVYTIGSGLHWRKVWRLYLDVLQCVAGSLG
jgi:hypothetical protein